MSYSYFRPFCSEFTVCESGLADTVRQVVRDMPIGPEGWHCAVVLDENDMPICQVLPVYNEDWELQSVQIRQIGPISPLETFGLDGLDVLDKYDRPLSPFGAI